jgi:putative tagatose-6-phosphate ketose/aldose isomerase
MVCTNNKIGKRKDMKNFFGTDKEILEEKKSFNTAKEILQQPKLWKEALTLFKDSEKDLLDFFSRINLNEEYRIIFTGAGTSEYVGNILEPFLNKNEKKEFESIATTDILNNPLNYFKKEKKTLIVSFARSGDSPESAGVIDIADKLIDEVYHLFITCNKEGALAKRAEGNEKIFLLLMPEESNDKGFAMTSSFSCMLLSGILAFSKNSEEVIEEMLKIIDIAEKELKNKYIEIKEIAEQEHKRIVVLGSGILKGLAQELSLKVMELSAGKVVSVSNTTLGFRHGPKAIVNNETIVFELINQDEYAVKYDEGLLEEMSEDKSADKLIAYNISSNDLIEESTYKVIKLDETDRQKIKNRELASLFIYLIYGQIYAFFKSQYLGNTTDNPFPSGEVNRVVKKFKVHKF